MINTQNNSPQFSQSDTIAPFVPLILFAMLWALGGSYETSVVSPLLLGAIGLVTLFWLPFVYAKQCAFIKDQKDGLLYLKLQAALIIASLIIPLAALFMGDVAGVAAFGDKAGTSSAATLSIGVLFYAACVFIFSSICNVFYVRYYASAVVTKVIMVLLTVIVTVTTAALAFLAYHLAYSLRDPSSE